MEMESSVTIGVCAMAKKANSKPMTQILDRLAGFGFVITVFDESAILNDPIEDWPKCDCMIAFFSSGFPLAKAEAYAELRKPYVVNDLHLQWTLMDRVKVYELLQLHKVPTPNFVVIDHASGAHQLLNFEDHVEYDGRKLKKPLVEKPRDAEDHNVCIYWPSSTGGGCTKLFRKVGDCSSKFCPDENDIRNDGVYIYEEFVNTQGVDVKVYTCGPDYAHAEARKAPAVDGRVFRNQRGKEERYPVILSDVEKHMARTVVLAFKQNICGMDILRSKSGSIVCDVNGWSFVKDSVKYWDDTAQSLRAVCLNAIKLLRAGKPAVSFNTESDGRRASVDLSTDSPKVLDPKKSDRSESISDMRREKLLRVSIVARHADRTPKQKMKMVTKCPELLVFCDVKEKHEEVKLKQAGDLQRLLETTRKLLEQPGDLNDSNIQKLGQLRQVLEMSPLGGNVWYRKVQLKPKTIREGKVIEMQLILKWGGQLTWAGKTQAVELGHRIRSNLYPTGGNTLEQGGSLLRLHATYRHDLKIYSSDEGRVVMSAAAFAKGLLDLENSLPPIASMMLQSEEATTKMLDIMPPAGRSQMDFVKEELSKIMHGQTPASMVLNDDDFKQRLDQLGKPPAECMRHVLELMTKLTEELSQRREATVEETCYVVPHQDHSKSDPVESLDFVYARWSKLYEEFYDASKDSFDISKLPDIYDCSLYDMLHSRPLQLKNLSELHEAAHALANFMVPLEYGLTKVEKSCIGISITNDLVRKLLGDIDRDGDVGENQNKDRESERRDSKSVAEVYQLDHNAVNSGDIKKVDRRVYSRVYFTSESHIISLLNVIRWGHERKDGVAESPLLSSEAAGLFDKMTADGMAFLTHLVITLHEINDIGLDKIELRVRILFSPGATNRDLSVAEAVPLTPPEGIPLERVVSFLQLALASDSAIDGGCNGGYQ